MAPSPTVQETVQRFVDITKDRISIVTKNGGHKKAWSGTSSESQDYENELRM